MKLRVIAIEDEPLAMKKLVGFIAKLDYLILLKTFDNAIEAISFLKNETVDLIFLDIQMEEFTGIQFLETVKTLPQIIITTAYSEYAIKGYEFNVTDYLLKPYTFDRFVKAVSKAADDVKNDSLTTASHTIFLKTESRLEKVVVADIQYIEGMSEYLRVVTSDKKLMTRQSFKSLANSLASPNFMRVHKSYMVALDKIDCIEKNRLTINEKIIPIGELYKESLFKALGI